ncbi:hypothetical protein TSUD_22080 [Trifolium subterraneum]|uniref:Uncharacterized protein n=1 Tax=Trifolium subterraneum TaxID=3900 RepID=A0A2Z6N4I2_TRISU|nr:hypothetical protein TSUD_22080 [Trifolium subterraneum]
MVMFRRGALVAAFNRLCEISCMSANDYKEALEGINSLCDKMNKRREGNVNGNNKANKSVVVLARNDVDEEEGAAEEKKDEDSIVEYVFNGVPHEFGYDVSRTIKHESQST